MAKGWMNDLLIGSVVFDVARRGTRPVCVRYKKNADHWPLASTANLKSIYQSIRSDCINAAYHAFGRKHLF